VGAWSSAAGPSRPGVKHRVEPKVVNFGWQPGTTAVAATASAASESHACLHCPLAASSWPQAWCPMVARGMKVIVIMMWYFLCDPARKRPGKCWRSVAEDTDWDQLTGTHECLMGGPEILREQRAALPHPTTALCTPGLRVHSLAPTTLSLTCT
jgi:hypothetical protein